MINCCFFVLVNMLKTSVDKINAAKHLLNENGNLTEVLMQKQPKFTELNKIDTTLFASPPEILIKQEGNMKCMIMHFPCSR